jgi:hypothetical protein
MRRRRSGVVALSAVALLLTAGCGNAKHDDARIVVPGFDRAGGALSDTHAGIPYTNGDLVMCLTKPGRIVITSIDQIDPQGGLRIDDFAVIPNAMEQGKSGIGDNNLPIAQQVAQPDDPVVMTNQCPASTEQPSPSPQHPRSVALLLQYGKPTDATASDKGIVLHYTSGGTKYSLTLDWEIDLCAPGDTTTGHCGP